jgi:hypothetical protein
MRFQNHCVACVRLSSAFLIIQDFLEEAAEPDESGERGKEEGWAICLTF